MRVIKTNALELVVIIILAGLLGASFTNACNRPAHAEDTPGVGYSANRMACALEGIQHSLERIQKERCR